MVLSSQYDVIIIGGGPAGMSAAVWCVDLGLKALVVEQKQELGGQMLRIFAPINNYPGVAAMSGQEMRDKFLESLAYPKFDLRLGAVINSLDLSKRRIKFADGAEVQAEALIIATGVRRRKLSIVGEEQFAGRGILGSGAKEKEVVKDSNVVIVGGGDAALENALILSQYASKVTLVHRRTAFSARPEFVREVVARPNVEIKLSSTVRKFRGRETLSSVEVESKDGSVTVIDASFALVRIGVEPNSYIFRNELKVDGKGYIEISQYCETSRTGIYAIGDVAGPPLDSSSAACASRVFSDCVYMCLPLAIALPPPGCPRSCFLHQL